MRKELPLLSLFFVLICLNLRAQDNEFKIIAPDNIKGRYPVGVQNSWGPSVKDFSGEVIWSRTAAGDSLGCSPAVNDMTGKVALVRRGTCSFSLKTYNAQIQGAKAVIICNNTEAAPDDIINMTAVDSVTAITIPAVLCTYATCDKIADELAAGNPVSVSYAPPIVYAKLGPYAYSTPKSQILPLDDIEFRVVNRGTEAISGMVASVDITDPNGEVTELKTLLGTLSAGADSLMTFESYTPSAIGEYTMHYYARAEGHIEYNSSDFIQKFVITESQYSQDNLNITSGSSGAFNQESYVAGGLVHDWGNVYLTGPSGAVALSGTFALNNPDSIPAGEFFSMVLYDIDPDGDGNVAAINYDNFSVIGAGGYEWTGNEGKNEIITVPMESLSGGEISMKPNGAFLIIAQYTGAPTNQQKCPSYTYSGTDDYPLVFDQALKSNQYYSGYVGHLNPVVRLNIDAETSVKEAGLAAGKIELFPNPVKDRLNIQFKLDNASYEADLFLMDIYGKVQIQERKVQMHNGVHSMDLKELAAGTYMLHVRTPEGNTTKKFVVVK